MLANLALRLVAVNVLRPYDQLGAAAPKWPTIAGAKVYDSRLDPDDAFSADETETGPVLVVYTEEDKTLGYGDSEIRPHDHHVKLLISASYYTRDTTEFETPDGETMALALDADPR